MLETYVFDVSVISNRFSISSQLSEVNELGLDVLRVACWFRGIFDEFHCTLAYVWLLFHFDSVDELEIDMAVMLEIDVFSRFSLEFMMF